MDWTTILPRTATHSFQKTNGFGMRLNTKTGKYKFFFIAIATSVCDMLLYQDSLFGSKDHLRITRSFETIIDDVPKLYWTDLSET